MKPPPARHFHLQPRHGRSFGPRAEGDREDIDRAVKAARAAFETGPGQDDASERGRLIWKLADLMEENLEEFAELESLDNGKPLKIARVADVPLAVDLFRYMAGWATKIEGNTIPISAASFLPIRCASRSASSGRLSPGISRC